MSANISEMVKKYREENKISLRKFADKAGLKTGTVAKIEKGFTHIQGETIAKLHKAMGMVVPQGAIKPKTPKIKFEVVEMEPWMEFKMQKTYSTTVIDLMDFLKTLPDKQPVRSTLADLGYANIQSARNSLRAIGKKYSMPMIKVAEKDGVLYIFKKSDE